MEPIDLHFNPLNYRTGSCKYNDQTIFYRAYENIPYVAYPNAPHLQIMNIYAPEEFSNDPDAPIFFIQKTGGMGEAYPASIENDERKAIPRALAEGYIVVSPGARGRDTIVQNIYVGRGDLPMTIIDLKAAVRYLRFNAGRIPGNPDKIVEEGASSGGGFSALLGVTGNSPLYQKYLNEIGAADARDDIFCCIVNAPITDLKHIDLAYEWMFSTENVDGLFREDALFTEISQRLAKAYEEYVNELGLKNPETGEPMNFINGDTYTPYLMEQLNKAATKYISSLPNERRTAWFHEEHNKKVISWNGEKATVTNMPNYINWNTGRWMRYVGSYDGFRAKPSRENEAFGSVDGTKIGHFNEKMGKIISEYPEYTEEGRIWVKKCARKCPQRIPYQPNELYRHP
ncbi:MAG: alpha/beta hydrolase [Clostridiales bacterium]|nr:alpha/beta hydrolase [Clostridiales bacterium]